VDFADAVAIAARIFGGSRDRSGGLLFAHGVEVAQALGPSATSTALNAAVLHDVLEDSEWTILDLRMSGVDAAICEAVDVLTRRSRETYMDYIRRICQAPGIAGETARLVKIADLEVNFARADSDALRERYERSLPLVQSALVTAS
jgi:(p)ppGpp synthase/HD superfamily hydrolase